jgi:hypothetical protein
MRRIQAEQELVDAQVSVNRAVFEMNQEDPRLGYMVREIGLAIGELRAVNRCLKAAWKRERTQNEQTCEPCTDSEAGH